MTQLFEGLVTVTTLVFTDITVYQHMLTQLGAVLSNQAINKITSSYLTYFGGNYSSFEMFTELRNVILVFQLINISLTYSYERKKKSHLPVIKRELLIP